MIESLIHTYFSSATKSKLGLIIKELAGVVDNDTTPVNEKKKNNAYNILIFHSEHYLAPPV